MSATLAAGPVELVVARLSDRGCNPRPRADDKWEARCPAHDDRSPSLTVAAGGDGRVLIHCHAGCAVEEIAAALGLTLADLFVPKAPDDRPRLAQTYDYVDADGTLLFQVARFEPKDFRQRRPDGAGGWHWNLNGTPRVLYRLPAVLEAVAAGRLVWVTEGEKDAEALQAQLPPGEVATCNPMGAGKWRPEYTATLEGAGVMVWADADATGRAHALEVAESLSGTAATVRVVQSSRFKDAAEHLGAGLTLDDIIEIDVAGEPAPEAVVASWDRVDLGPVVAGILDGTIQRLRPEVGQVEDVEPGLFVSCKVNGMHGFQGTGKTMVALVVAAQELAAGRVVWFLDFEDDADAIVLRLIELGVDPAAIVERLHYRRPDDVLDLEAQGRLQAELAASTPSLVIVDSTGEWMGLHGIEDKDVHVARFMNTCARPLAATGAAVVLLDHVPHAEKERLAPIGSQRKIAAVNGCQYLVTTVAEMARGRIGKARLTVAKDRTGTRAKATVAAELLLDSTGDGMAARLLAPSHDAPPAGGPLAGLPPAARRVEAVLANATEEVTVATIGDLVAEDGTTGTGLKRRTIQDALSRLEELDLAVRTPSAIGDRWSHAHQPPKREEIQP